MDKEEKEKNETRPTFFGSTESQAPTPDAALIKEAVRLTVEQYGEVLRRLADE